MCCLTEFFSRKGLMQHLRYGKPLCLQLTMDNCLPVAHEEMARLQAVDTKARKGARTSREVPRPAVRATGPLPSWAA